MIFTSIKQHEELWPVRLQCSVLGVSASGYYAWLNRAPSKRAVANQNLLQDILRVHLEHSRRYGSPRVYRELKAEGQRVSRSRIEKLMRLNNLQAISHSRVRMRTTDSDHQMPVAENILDRNFGSLGPNQKWSADITYVPTGDGWLFLAIILDLYTRKIVGWAMREHMRTELVMAALMMAVQRQRPAEGLIAHSDRGSQYASHEYREALQAAGMVQSMSRKGNCWDNAPAESFFHTLKTELVHHKHYATKEDAKRDLFHYIEGYYNSRRIHSAIGYVTPNEMELKAA
jgi:transposase InsO family protein